MDKSKIEQIEKLQQAITNMDSLSQDGFSEIAAIARITIKALEGGACVRPIEDVIKILDIIWAKANDIENCINGEAEDVGCHYMSETTKQEINEALGVSNHE